MTAINKKVSFGTENNTKQPLAIHQFHSGSAVGDAVTGSMFFIQEILRKFGFVSEIYAEHIPSELTEKIKHFTQYHPGEEDVLLIHHSMGHEQIEWIINLSVTKILVYHNITPSTFFPPESPYHYYSKVGREQLLILLPEMLGAIADSEFNAQELTACGYKNVSIIPLLVDVTSLQRRTPALNILESANDTFTILFVGRISPNKCQADLIDILDCLQTVSDRLVQLVLIGGYDDKDPYYISLQEKISCAGLEEQVVLTGKVSDEELTAWYRISDVFICMSEHEGFGVPLIEAMAYDLPVIAYKSSNVPLTMAGAGLLVTEKNMEEIAALVQILSKDRILRRAVIDSQRQRIKQLTRDKLASSLSNFFSRNGISISDSKRVGQTAKLEKKYYQVEGPFETSYSLALVNRHLAFALNELSPGLVSLFATEGPGDYEPDVEAIEAISGLKELFDRGQKKSRADVVIRNLYPPRVVDMDGLINILSIAWEESGFPFQYVADLNKYVDGVAVTSKFVRKVLIDNGVCLPIQTIGNGFDHIWRTKAVASREELPAGYKFLHISSCFPRKGVDVLLKAFCATFSYKDDVSLIIKTFPNIHNTIHQQVAALRQNYENFPKIKIIECDLSAGQIVDLYRQCDAFVAPSRGEGFGLPMAEAMWFGLPVITTGFGGQTDFCTDKTSWLIDYSFQTAKTHLEIFNSVWAEPSSGHLGQLMHEVWSAEDEQLRPRRQAARKLLQSKFTWQKSAERLLHLEKRILKTKPRDRKKIKLGWVSSWNVKCGIATYSNFLLQSLEQDNFDIVILASSEGERLSKDAENVFRCWKTKNKNIDQLIDVAGQSQFDVLVIQFNWVFFSLADLCKLIDWAKRKKIIVLVMFHATKDLEPPHGSASLKTICRELAQADRLLVHGIDDLNRFKDWGLVENVALFPHGVQKIIVSDSVASRKIYNISEDAMVIASYGFLLPHKGIDRLIEAFSILQQKYDNLQLVLVNALYPEPSSSRKFKRKCISLIERFGLTDSVLFETNFLSDDESVALLNLADMVVFSYQETAESSSAAARYALSLGKPVAVTPLKIFSDVQNIVHILPGTSAESIAAGLEELLFVPERLLSKQAAQRKWLEEHCWHIVGKRLEGMLKGLVENCEN